MSLKSPSWSDIVEEPVIACPILRVPEAVTLLVILKAPPAETAPATSNVDGLIPTSTTLLLLFFV